MLTGGLEISRPLIIVWVIPALGVILALIATRWSSPTTRGRMLVLDRLVVLAYLTGAIVLTLWPLDVDVSFARIEHGNWTPFEGTLGFFISQDSERAFLGGRDVLANVVLFVPLGLLLPFAFYQWRGIALSLGLLVFIAFSLEITQGITIAERTFDIDDAIAGCAGGLVGALGAVIVRPVAGR